MRQVGKELKKICKNSLSMRVINRFTLLNRWRMKRRWNDVPRIITLCGVWPMLIFGAVTMSACSTTPSFEAPQPPPSHREPLGRAYPAPYDREVLRTPDDSSGVEVIRIPEDQSYPDEPDWVEESDSSEAADDDAALYSVEVRLLADAKRYVNTGRLQLASASIERALRINPHSSLALYELAKIHMAQSEPRDAEQLLLKAISDARYDARSRDKAFQRQVWQLVLEARRALRDGPGIIEAQARLRGL